MTFEVVSTGQSAVFNTAYNEGLVHQVVIAQMAGARAGTKAQKTRSEVRGGGIKPWRQKGTGRARAGTIRSPIWRSGGITFAAKPRDFSQKVNRKMYRSAVKSIVSELLRQDRIVIVKSLSLTQPKTRELAAALNTLSLQDVLILTSDIDANVLLAARNIPHVSVQDVAHVSPLALLQHERILVTEEAMKQLEEKFS